MKRFHIFVVGVILCISLLYLYINFRTHEVTKEFPLDKNYEFTNLGTTGSRRYIECIVDQYRNDFPHSEVSDEKLIYAIIESKLELERRSRWITITVKSRDQDLAYIIADTQYKFLKEHYCKETNGVGFAKGQSKLEKESADVTMQNYVKATTTTMLHGPLRNPPVQQ